MPIITKPSLHLMPSFIEGLKNGYRLDNQTPKSAEDISKIENDAQGFFDNFIKQKTMPIPSGKETFQRNEFWYVENDVFIGRLNIRHGLSEQFAQFAGNIGYEVVPAHQGKGHASAMLQWALDFCRNNTDLTKVLLTTADDNAPSIKVIEKYGGILENKVKRPDGALGRRYWITL